MMLLAFELTVVSSPFCRMHSSSMYLNSTARFSQTAVTVLFLNVHHLASVRAAAHFADPQEEGGCLVYKTNNKKTPSRCSPWHSLIAVKWELAAVHKLGIWVCLLHQTLHFRRDNQTEAPQLTGSASLCNV